MHPTRRILSLLILLQLATYTVPAQLVLQFDNRVAGRKLVTDSVSYATPSGDSLTISLLQYFISNITLRKASGEKLVLPVAGNYFLIKQSDDTSRRIALDVPAGVYKDVSFLVGIDSLSSTLPVEKRTGVLDPAQGMSGGEGMYWTWNSGYIFFKLEGSSPSVPKDKTGFREFQYHIGGYGGYNTPTLNNLRRVNITLPEKSPLRIRANHHSVVHIRFDVATVLKGIDLATQHHMMLTPESSGIADNYAAGFTYGGTEYPNR
ncbi:MbnP family protein [Paraflavitalea pollutisoli]|uniref:MbnP family protein n=1 Tax=Paraflavitalea pollutisoli TaxID=3034143 RepID=UPI0023EE28EB|nr:MbnP family protein [Paraflavitalea sp. H1-2-19X]